MVVRMVVRMPSLFDWDEQDRHEQEAQAAIDRDWEAMKREAYARKSAGVNPGRDGEDLLVWEHELGRPMDEYYNYFLEEVVS